MNIEIKHWLSGHVLFKGIFDSFAACTEAAIESGANLSGADLRSAKNADLAIACTRILPEGAIVGWKKCTDGVLVKLFIPADAKRNHAFGRKCRAELPMYWR